MNHHSSSYFSNEIYFKNEERKKTRSLMILTAIDLFWLFNTCINYRAYRNQLYLYTIKSCSLWDFGKKMSCFVTFWRGKIAELFDSWETRKHFRKCYFIINNFAIEITYSSPWIFAYLLTHNFKFYLNWIQYNNKKRETVKKNKNHRENK